MSEENPSPLPSNLPPPSVPPPRPDIPPPSISTPPPPPPPSPRVSEEASAASSTPAAPPVKMAAFAEGEKQSALPAASFNVRFVAVIIDSIVAFGLGLGTIWILPGFMSLIGQLLSLGYFLTRDCLPFLGGQSIGKKVMNLRAVTLDGKSLSENWQASLIRNGVLIIPLFALVEIYVLLTREGQALKGLRLGDEWAKTRVIVAPAPQAPPEA